jgi:hypothetical protein
MHPLYDIVLKDLRTDLEQMLETGHDRGALEAELDATVKAGSLDSLTLLQETWWTRPSPPSFSFEEPHAWEMIRAGFPAAESHARFTGSEAELGDRLLAAWRGRCAGCQLGKPLEGTTWPDKIQRVLEIAGSWPLTDYMKPTPSGVDAAAVKDLSFFDGGHPWRQAWCKGNFSDVAPDDDIHYAITSLMVLERHGVAFTPQQAIDVIVSVTPRDCLFAAGKNMLRTSVFGVPTPLTAVMGNPCRQSLGAMIRCDPFGWCAPGHPALAASMAYRDAVNSQVRNGIYAGIFFAVLMADTLAHGDPIRAIETATAYVPPRSRFAEMVRLVQTWCKETDDWQKVARAILERWPGEAKQFNHAITNAAIVLLGLYMGKGDFGRTLCTTVMAGLDTDCTGATVGSIMGCALGTRGIPESWTAPFRDTVRTELRELGSLRISELAKRTLAVASKNARRHPGALP